MSKKRMLADVLREAADVWLDQFGFSCHAALQAAHGNGWPSVSPIDVFFESLGCEPDSPMTYQLSDIFADTDCWAGRVDAMGTRYIWLLLAAQVAEDEGIELP